ncbi:hypothetical protein BD560DRAFT_493212 [Blakeslea trispora]|nr:hypothetical protein BD560DRAFT_493212 [Blakeslea trispora]
MSYGSLLATCLVFFPRSAMACNYNRRCDGERLLLSRDPPEEHIVRARLRGQDNLAVCDGRNLKKMKILGERDIVRFSLFELNVFKRVFDQDLSYNLQKIFMLTLCFVSFIREYGIHSIQENVSFRWKLLIPKTCCKSITETNEGDKVICVYQTIG